MVVTVASYPGHMATQPRSIYQELPADRTLAGAVACTWVQRVGEGGWSQLVMPDGCADIIWSEDQGLRVAGPATVPVNAPVSSETTLVAVRFRPGAAGGVLGVPAGEIRDLGLNLRELWGREADRLTARLARQRTAAERTAVLQAAVGARLSDRVDAIDALVAAVAARLGRPGMRVAELGVEAGVSERQLLRRFQDAVGYGPKTLDRILRFRRFLDRAEQAGSERDLATLAIEAGYADQAHLTRECRRLSGLPPTALLRRWTAEPPAA